MTARPFIVLLLLAALLPLSYAQSYQVSLVRANDSNVSSLVYDDDSTSYKDNSMENPDMLFRICAPVDPLLGKYAALAYADGQDGDYLIVTHAAVLIDAVDIANCAEVPLEIHSFRAWYPSIPYVFISDTPNLAGASRTKLSRLRGWFIGNYTTTLVQVGNEVNVTVTGATEDGGASIVPDVDYLVIGLVRPDYTTMDTIISSPNNLVTLNSDGGNYSLFINGIGPDLPPYVHIITPEDGMTYDTGTLPFNYTITDDDDIASCYYVLDGVTFPMAVCGIPYILDLGSGEHTLTLYATDSTNQTSSDSVTFTIGGAVSPPSGGGGGTHVPYYNVTHPPTPPGNATNITQCDIILYCGEWGECIDGTRTQICRDTGNCSDIAVTRTESCLMPPGGPIGPDLPKEIIRILVSPEPFPCWPLFVLLLLIIIFFVLYRRRSDQEDDIEERQREKWKRKV
jgi:hypothetical protein